MSDTQQSEMEDKTASVGADQSSVEPSTSNLSNLQENFNQQQAKISALKELVRQSEEDQGKNTANVQEKVRNIAQRLTHLKTKASRSRQSEKSFSEIREELTNESHTNITLNENSFDSELQYSMSSRTTPSSSRARSETPGSEKIQLLRQQMEQNRLKMAERESNKRGVEELVTQLKAKFNSSQLSLDRAHLLGNSVGDLSALPQRYQSTGDLNAGFNLDRERIKYLEKRVKHLENEMKQKENDFLHKDPQSEQSKLIKQLNSKVVDLEESLREKDGIIDARTKAASLITESLSLKGKDTVDMLEETKQEMIKMQTNFVATEDELNKRISSLVKEIQNKDKKIANLEEVNDILETARFDLTLKNSQLDSRTGSADDYVNKINELNKINETLQHRIESLECDQKENEPAEAPINKEMLHKIQELESKITELHCENDDLKKSLQSALNTPESDTDAQERINNLDATIAAQKEELIANANLLQNVQDQLMEKTVEYNVLMANFNVLEEKLKSYGPKSLFSKSTDEEAQAEINKLTKQLDEANKTGIRTKLKMKQLQKQIDTFKKTSDTNKEFVKLMDENQKLNDKLKELETEILTLRSQQLQSAADDGTEINKDGSEFEAKIKLLETTCQNQTSAIQLLEEQKLDMTADLNNTKTELTSLKENIKESDKNEVTNQMDSIAYEERIEQFQQEINELKGQINRLVVEKRDLKSKLDRYANENMELLEKIDKLSKGSSAESIEILERLTQEERMEMERFQQVVEKERQQYDADNVGAEKNNESKSNDVADNVHSKDSSTDESTILSDETISRMNALLEENNQLTKLIEVLRAEKLQVLNEFEELKVNNLSIISELREIESERETLLGSIREVSEIRTKLEDEISQMKQERDAAQSKAGNKSPEKLHFIEPESLEDYRSGLKNITTELENYRNARDNKAKVNASKKLAKQSKNVSELMEKLLENYNSCKEEYAEYKAEVDGERAAKETYDKHRLKLLADGINECEVDELKKQITALQDIEAGVTSKYSNLEEQLQKKELSLAALEKSTVEIKAENDRLNEHINSLETELNGAKEHGFQELQKQRKEFDNLFEANKKEVEILKKLVEEQKQQLITAYSEHEQDQLEKENTIASYYEQVQQLQAELNNVQSQMQSANKEYADRLSDKMASMQALLNENKELNEQQTEELANKQSTIESLNQQIMSLYKSMEDNTAQLAEKDDEIEHLQSLVDKNRAEIKKMNQQNLTSEKKAKDLDHALKQKEVEFEKCRSEWEKIRTDLETKNKEQLDKLKKFAANLKKRNQQYAELEEKYANLEKSSESPVNRIIVQEVNTAPVFETATVQQSSNDADELAKQKEINSDLEQKLSGCQNEIQRLNEQINHKTAELENLKMRLSEKSQLYDEITSEADSKQTKIIELTAELMDLQNIKEQLNITAEDLKAKNIKIEKCKAVIKERNKEIKRLQDIEQSIKDKDTFSDGSVSELKLQLDQVQNEKEKINSEFNNYRSFIETKLQNNDLVFESIETENAQLKDRIARLEENISFAEERRSSLERHSELLGLQLQQKQKQMECVEDEYGSRLKALVNQDEIIEQKLKDLEYERDNLMTTIKEQETRIEEFKDRNGLLEKQLNDLETTKLAELEMDNKELSIRIEKLETESERKQQEFDVSSAKKQAELEDLENELSNHLQNVERERRSIQEDLEKSREENAMLHDQIVQLHESQTDLEQARNELVKEINWMKIQNDNMTQDQMEAQDLRMQVVHDQTEVENLQAQNVDLIERHRSEIDSLQSQIEEANAQRLQAEAQVQKLSIDMGAVKEELSLELDTLRTTICEDQAALVNLRLRYDQLVVDRDNEVSNLHGKIHELSADHNELENLRANRQQLDNEIVMLRQQVSQLDALQMNVGQNITQDQLEVHQLRNQIIHDQTEIESLRHQVQQLNANHESELAALRQQIAELDSLRMQVGQNQTDDQVFIQNENERLQSLLAEKEMEIQNYQRQNLQLQMSAGMAVSNDPFASFTTPLIETNESSNRVAELEARLENIVHESNELQAKCNELQRLCAEKDLEILHLQQPVHNISSGSMEGVVANEPIVTSHQTQSLNMSPFDIQSSTINVSVDNNASPVPTGDHGQQIEDLQRNVSDLEKYVTDLEHKLKAANEENSKHYIERVNLKKQFEEQLFIKQAELETLNNKLISLQANVERQYQNQQQQQQQQQQKTPEQLPTTAALFSSPELNPFVDIGQSNDADDAECAGLVPVVEETIVPKKAYLCYPEDQHHQHHQHYQQQQQQQQSDASGFTVSESQSDGWGDSSWGNEAILEEQHQQQSVTLAQSGSPSVLNRATIDLQVQIDELKTEREKMSSELSALQIKYQKLLKKLREYKAKIDEHEHSKQQPQSSMTDSSDLDLAIQEELNSQIKALERRLRELKAEQEKESQEKKKLLNRIDVLTAANDRMIELKEKQDIEIDVCKSKIRELNGKLEKLNDWDENTGPKSGNEVELAARLTTAQNHNRLLEERISRMQAAVNDKDDFEEEREQYFEQMRVLTAEKVMLEENILIKDKELGTLFEKLNALEDQNNDYKATIEVLSVESNNIKMYLDQLKDEHKQKIDENINLSEKLKELVEKNTELAKQVNEMRMYNLNSEDVEQRIQNLNASIQYKDSEILAFNDKFENQSIEHQKLSDEFANNTKIIAELKQEIVRLTNEKSSLEQQLHQQAPAKLQTDNANAAEEVQRLKEIVHELREEKVQMETELQVLNDQVIKNMEIEDRIKSTVLELDMKNIEISELKNSLQQINQNQSTITAPSSEEIVVMQRKIQENDAAHQSAIDLMNAQWQQVVDQKCAELADSWRHHLQLKEEEFAQIEQDLRSQLEQQSVTNTTTPEKTQNSSKFSEMSSESRQQSFEQKSEEVDADQAEMIKIMQTALESQEIEIVSLKEQLAIRSAEYARIAASVDPYGMKATSSSNAFLSNERPNEETIPKGNEINLALYMLHQRDMRCEELTEEVIHLLEERDTLQLKLSNSIRQLEEYKRRNEHEVQDGGEASTSSPAKPTQNPTSDNVSSQDSKEHSENVNLGLKLSELHNVNHSRDKRLYEEREQRRRQMELFQRDVANMPPEAIAELFGPDYNPNIRNNQNASSMILNWLWGNPSSNESQN